MSCQGFASVAYFVVQLGKADEKKGVTLDFQNFLDEVLQQCFQKKGRLSIFHVCLYTWNLNAPCLIGVWAFFWEGSASKIKDKQVGLQTKKHILRKSNWSADTQFLLGGSSHLVSG